MSRDILSLVLARFATEVDDAFRLVFVGMAIARSKVSMPEQPFRACVVIDPRWGNSHCRRQIKLTQ